MITAFNLAGFFAAHAVWCVSDGEGLVPIFAYIGENGEKKMERLAIGDDLEKSVIYGRGMLESNKSDANDAVLLYDAGGTHVSQSTGKNMMRSSQRYDATSLHRLKQ